MSDLVRTNPILAQYVPKPDKGFATFGYKQGAENVVKQEDATQALQTELEEVKISEGNLQTALAELARKKEEHAKKVAERQAKEAEKATLTNEVNALRGQVAQARTDLAAAQAAVQAAQANLKRAQDEKAEKDRLAAEAAARSQYSAPSYQAPAQPYYAAVTPPSSTVYIPPIPQSSGVPSGQVALQPTMNTIAPSVSTFTPQQTPKQTTPDGFGKFATSYTPEQYAAKESAIGKQVASVLSKALGKFGF